MTTSPEKSWSPLGARSGALLLSLCAACAGPDVRPELSRAGFRTPVQTFETYRAAFLSDLPDLEYLCFSDSFRSANGISRLTYAEGREILLREQSFLRFGLGRARIESVVPLSENRVRLKIRSKSLFHDTHFVCELVREDFYEIWAGGQRLQDDHLPRFSSAFRTTDDGSGRTFAQAYVPLEAPDRGSEITEFRVGREWKIDFITQLDPANGPDPHGRETLDQRQAQETE